MYIRRTAQCCAALFLQLFCRTKNTASSRFRWPLHSQSLVAAGTATQRPWKRIGGAHRTGVERTLQHWSPLWTGHDGVRARDIVADGVAGRGKRRENGALFTLASAFSPFTCTYVPACTGQGPPPAGQNVRRARRSSPGAPRRGHPGRFSNELMHNASFNPLCAPRVCSSLVFRSFPRSCQAGVPWGHLTRRCGRGSVADRFLCPHSDTRSRPQTS